MFAFLYRLFDAEDNLLYVGATTHLNHRIAEHASTQAWWGEVDLKKATMVCFDDIASARRAEADAIIREKPRHNRNGVRTGRRKSANPYAAPLTRALMEVMEEKTQEEFATEIGVGQPAVSRLLRNGAVSQATAKKILQHYPELRDILAETLLYPPAMEREEVFVGQK